ncbi:MAG TPA: ribonuclease III [Ruminococcaceae bacterium]|nr:ribonuclease III [Oscillospiraceae bacterium]
MGRLYNEPADLRALSPLTLAFVGDAVLSLFIREYLAVSANRPAGVLHRMSVEYVRAPAQADAAKKIAPFLSEEETGIFRRGRNAHTGHTPKNASTADYHSATGLEALIGYLYLQNKTGRIRELMDIIYGDTQGKL